MKMFRYIELLLIGLFLIKKSTCSSDIVIKPKIAIVGAGIGGASASYFLTELLDAEIDIFEANEIGGRVRTLKVGAKEYEAGGIICSQHRYMKHFVKLFTGSNVTIDSRDWKNAIWTGDEFIFKESYLPASKKFFGQRIYSIVDNFKNIYKHQDNGETYDNVIDLISAMSTELAKLMQVSTAEFLNSSGVSNSINDELVKSILIGDYGQSIEIHSFAGLLSLNTADDYFWTILGGIKQVPEHLIYKNCKVSIVHSQVKAIRYFVNDESLTQYEISYSNPGDNNVVKNIYDIVIIAAPLTTNQIESVGFPKNDILQIPGNYQIAVATFVQGNLNFSHFGLNESIDSIRSSNSNKTEFDVISKVDPIDGYSRNDSQVWVVIGRKHLTSDQISSMFSQVEFVEDIEWTKAYPIYSTDARSDKFELYDSLYHLNAIEWATSSTEMSAIAAKNVALLIHKKLASCCRDSSEKEKRRCKYSCRERNECGTESPVSKVLMFYLKYGMIPNAYALAYMFM